MLVLIDNLEQVIDAAADIAALLASIELTLLVTSRQPLRVGAEMEIDVPPLANDDAVDLFVERARVIDTQFAADEHVPEICARLDGLPLAIELAAARVRVLAPQAILERLTTRLPLLTSGRRDAPERQRTLRATIAWTYDLLGEHERLLFARLSVFQGGWSLDAAEVLCAATIDVLESLVEKSLVRRIGDRYFMLETIREFAAELLDDDDLRLRHAHWFEQLVARLEPQLRTSEQAQALATFVAEIDNVRAALTFARAAQRFELEAMLAGACWYFWMWTGSFSEGHEALLSADRADGLSPTVRAQILEGLASMVAMGGEYPSAQGYGEEALQIRRSVGEPEGILRALINLSWVYGRGAEPGRDVPLLEEARLLAADTGSTWFEAVALGNLGSAALVDSNLDAAVSYLRPAVALASSLSDRFILASAETNLAAALIAKGIREEALELYRRACLTWMDLGSPEGQIWCLEGFAFAAADDDPETAARLGGASLRACQEIGYVLPEQEQRWRKRRLERLAAKLDAARIHELELEGRNMSLPESIDYAFTAVAR